MNEVIYLFMLNTDVSFGAVYEELCYVCKDWDTTVTLKKSVVSSKYEAVMVMATSMIGG